MNDFIIENGRLIKYSGNETVVHIPEGVKEICEDSIELKSIRKLYIPKSVKCIDSLAEYEVVIKPGTDHEKMLLTDINKKNLTIYLEHNFKEYLKLDFFPDFLLCNAKVMIKKNREYVQLQEIEELIIPEKTRWLANFQFSYCNVKKVVLGKNIKILSQAFYGCTKLKEIVFNDNLEKIEEDCFSDCTSLGPVLKLPKTVKLLGHQCFRNCQKLKTIYCNLNDLKIESGAFDEITHPITLIDYETGFKIIF